MRDDIKDFLICNVGNITYFIPNLLVFVSGKGSNSHSTEHEVEWEPFFSET